MLVGAQESQAARGNTPQPELSVSTWFKFLSKVHLPEERKPSRELAISNESEKSSKGTLRRY